jgi:hypothetical protein
MIVLVRSTVTVSSSSSRNRARSKLRAVRPGGGSDRRGLASIYPDRYRRELACSFRGLALALAGPERTAEAEGARQQGDLEPLTGADGDQS